MSCDREFQNIFDKLEEIPPSKIMDKLGIERRNVQWYGPNHYKCLCPFPGHSDGKTGSFDVNDDKLMAKCFACNKGGRPIRFFRDLCGLDSDFEAGIRMAMLFGVLDKDRGARILREDSGLSFKMPETYDKAPKCNEQAYIEEPPMADLQTRSKFYETYTSFLPLLDRDREYLLSRGVREDELEQFFSYPNDYKKVELPAFKAAQEALGWPMERFIGIPGVFICTPDSGATAYARPIVRRDPCIGIKICDVDGRVVGIQFRNYKPTTDGRRYFWMSSSFVNSRNTPMFSNGRSGNAPAGFQPGRGTKVFSTMVITEGKFKALALSRMGLQAFTVQGVGNWSVVIPEIEHYLELHPEQQKKIYLAFDADQKTNPAVAKATIGFYNYLVEHGYEVKILDWDIEKGKGIDDALEVKAPIRKIPGEVYMDRFIRPMIQREEEMKKNRQRELLGL